jgi:anti-sigma B factor antagonist
VLSIEVQNAGDTTVLRCSGRIVHGDGADELLRTASSQQKSNLVIDFSGVNVIDAAGVGVLVALQRWADTSNRRMQIVHPNRRVREVLETTKLTSLLETPQTRRAARDVA